MSIEEVEQGINDKIIEMKETRNLLVHNNLTINEIYLNKCKGYCRATEKEINTKIEFDDSYVKKCLELCIDFIDKYLLPKLSTKYKEYTKIKAMKEIWDYLFSSPILKFDDYWNHDGTYLKSFKLDIEKLEGRISGGYSGTESILLFFLLLQYNDSLVESYSNKFGYRFLNLCSLHGQRKEKYLYIQEVLTKYPSLFQQDMSWVSNHK